VDNSDFGILITVLLPPVIAVPPPTGMLHRYFRLRKHPIKTGCRGFDV